MVADTDSQILGFLSRRGFTRVPLPTPLGPVIKDFWARDDRYEAVLEVELAGKRIRLHPLPHPSPLNATWYPRFPALLDARLASLGWPP